MNTAPAEAMKNNADMVTQALISHYALPAFVGIILIGLIAIAWELLKGVFRTQARDRKQTERKFKRR
jgi:hypothetical protein